MSTDTTAAARAALLHLLGDATSSTAVEDLEAAVRAESAETLRALPPEEGEGYEVRVWQPHRPSKPVVLPGHPQLGGRYCTTDGADWPCDALRAALAATPAEDERT